MLGDISVALPFVASQCASPLASVAQLAEQLANPEPQPWYLIRDEGRAPEDANLGRDFYRSPHPLRVQWGQQLAARYDFGPHRELLDIGGASGGWGIGIRQRFPHLRCTVFDIAPACRVADELIAQAGQQEHMRTVMGDFFADRLPAGADVALLANVLHDWDLEDGRRILDNVAQALPKGATLLINEAFFADDWSAPNLFALYQALAVIGQDRKCGWQPSFGEMEALVAQHGFASQARAHNLLVAVRE